MLRLVMTIIAIATVATATEYDDTWGEFKKTYNKHYVEAMDVYRRAIFFDNMEYIERHNLEADVGLHSYWLGANEFTDLLNHEFRALLNGYKMSNRTRTGTVFLQPENMLALPDMWDWREHGYVTPVKNQGQCGSCWAFSSTGAMEGQHYRKTGKLVSLSEQNLVDCSTKEGNEGCNGGYMDQAFDYVKLNGGIDKEECYPYHAKEGHCQYRPGCRGSGCTGRVDIPRGDEHALKKACATVGPISVAIDASHRSFQLYRSGVYNEPDCSTTALDHAVLVVGYGTTENRNDYWIVKNSWGTSWGMKGYINMSRNKHNQCGIATEASYPLF